MPKSWKQLFLRAKHELIISIILCKILKLKITACTIAQWIPTSIVYKHLEPKAKLFLVNTFCGANYSKENQGIAN